MEEILHQLKMVYPISIPLFTEFRWYLIVPNWCRIFFHPQYQWEFQDPKMEVLYHFIRLYLVAIFPEI